MKKYFDKHQLSEFKKSLSDIRKSMGSESLSTMDSTYGVEGSTFRAYRGYTKAPSEVFRNWAEKKTEKITGTQPTKSISSLSDFSKWHTSLAKSLSRSWKNEQGKTLSFAHTYKLVDLYLKWLSHYKFSDPNFVINLNKYASAALDKHTLNRINLCYSQCMPINSPSMGDIHNENTYEFCQEIIDDFCTLAKATKLEFDYWAWNEGS